MPRAQRIEVTFLSTLHEVAGRGTMWLDLPSAPTVARALARLRERMPQLAGVAVTANVNGAAARPEQLLRPGDSLFLLPPDGPD